EHAGVEHEGDLLARRVDADVVGVSAHPLLLEDRRRLREAIDGPLPRASRLLARAIGLRGAGLGDRDGPARRLVRRARRVSGLLRGAKLFLVVGALDPPGPPARLCAGIQVALRALEGALGPLALGAGVELVPALRVERLARAHGLLLGEDHAALRL